MQSINKTIVTNKNNELYDFRVSFLEVSISFFIFVTILIAYTSI